MLTTDRKLRVFICHASQDKPIVRELYQKLLAEGWIDAWLDEEQILPGQDWNIEIEKAVEAADAVIVCLSNNSVSKEGYVQRELRFVLDIALEKPQDTIFEIPLRLDDCTTPRRLKGKQYVDYFPVERREIVHKRLLASLRIRANVVGVDVTKLSTESSKVSTQIAQNELSAIHEFKLRSGDFFGKPLRIRQASAADIERISTRLQLEELIQFANSKIAGERISCGIALRAKIISDSSLSENIEVQRTIQVLITDDEAFVRYRALRAIAANKDLIIQFRKQIQKCTFDKGLEIQKLAKTLLSNY